MKRKAVNQVGGRRVLSTGVDVSVLSGSQLDRVDLASECGGAPDNHLNPDVIPDGTIVILRRGNTMQRVRVNQILASECVFNRLGVSRELARRFRLRHSARYTLTYNTATRTLTIRRQPITFYRVTVRGDARLAVNRVVIGNGLGIGGALGINVPNGSLLALRSGNVTIRLRLRQVSREFDLVDVFRLHPVNVRRLNVTAGTTYRVAYNQVTRTLRFLNPITTVGRKLGK